MKRVWFEGSVQHQIAFAGARYQTVRPLANFKTARGVATKSTRVWAVRQLGHGGVPSGRELVLKDSWARPDCIGEAAKYKTIIDESRHHPSAVGADVSKHLIGVLGDQVTQVGGSPDSLLRIRRYQQLSTPPDGPTLETTQAPSAWVSEVSSVSSVVFPSVGGYDWMADRFSAVFAVDPFQDRSHYRVLYSEVASVLHSLKDYIQVCQATFGASKGRFMCQHASLANTHVHAALSALQALEWVHRDISPGNIYLSDDGVGKISDIEYAKKLDTTEGLRLTEMSPTVCVSPQQ